MISFIIFSIQFDNQIIIKELIDYDSISDFISQKLINENLITLQSYLSIFLILLYNILINHCILIKKFIYQTTFKYVSCAYIVHISNLSGFI